MTDDLPEIPEFLNRAETSRFQTLPALSAEDYVALKNDIKERGVMVPVEYDQHWNIIDGHHRVRACKELGITEWPQKVRTYDDDTARLRQALKLNIARRHLDSPTKRALIETVLRDGPTQSDRTIAKQVGASNKTVAAARRGLVAREEIPHVASRVDAKGRKQPAKKVPKHLVVISKPTKQILPKRISRETITIAQKISVLTTLWADINNDALRAAWAESDKKVRRAFWRWLENSVDQTAQTIKG